MGTWEYYMRIALRKLLLCDSICLLKGWEYSEGARMEFALAGKLKMPVSYWNPTTQTLQICN